MCIDEKWCTVIILAVPSLQNVKIHPHHPGVLVAGFMRPWGQYKFAKMTQGDNKVNNHTNHQEKFSRFFDFFQNEVQK
jgi:hypothetical protein